MISASFYGAGSVIVTTVVYVLVTIIIMLKRTGTTKQRSDDRTTNLSRLIMIDNLRIERFVCVGRLRCVTKMCGGKTSKS